jgi:hypothetical protein
MIEFSTPPRASRRLERVSFKRSGKFVILSAAKKLAARLALDPSLRSE